MKKSILVGMLVFSLAALMVVGGTLAWFTSEAEVTNTFTAGTVEIEVLEKGETEDITNWNPGDTTDYDVSVKSLGSKQTYVRVKLEPVWYDGDEEAEVDENNVELTLAEDWEDYWVLADGWYYYKNILGEDDETSLLLDKVHLKGKETGNEYQGLTLKIKVEAQAVQASNKAYQDAWDIDALPDGVEEWTGGANY